METPATKACRACAMDIRQEATRCPHCRTWQDAGQSMHRGHPERTLAGVCAALGHQFNLDVALVRVLFLVALVVTGGSAAGLYLLLWVFTPAGPGQKAPVVRFVDGVVNAFSRPAEPFSPPPAQGPGTPTY